MNARLQNIPTKKKVDKSKSEDVLDVEVDDSVKNSIDLFCTYKQRIDDATSEMRIHEALIKNSAVDKYDEIESNGEFTKSMKFKTNTCQVRVTRQDKFSIKKGVDVRELKSKLGPDASYVEQDHVYRVRPEVFKTPAILDRFLEKFTDDELSEFIERDVVHTIKKGFDKKMGSYSREKKEEILDLMDRQNPSITVLENGFKHDA